MNCLPSASDCKWSIVKGTTNTKGKASVTFQVCNPDKQCNFIAKRLLLPKHDKVQKEISKQKQFSDLGIAPKIVDVLVTQNPYDVILVMEKVDFMIDDYILSLKLPLQEVLDQLKVIETATLALVKQTIARGLIHGDLKLDNIGFNLRGNEFSIQLIDFGFFTSSPDSIVELEMSFQALENRVREKLQGAQPIKSIFFNTSPSSSPVRGSSFESPVKSAARDDSYSPVRGSPLFGTPVKTSTALRDPYTPIKIKKRL